MSMTEKQKADMLKQLSFHEDEYMELTTLDVVEGVFGARMLMYASNGEVVDSSFKEESDPYKLMFRAGIEHLIAEEEKAGLPCPDRLEHLRSLLD